MRNEIIFDEKGRPDVLVVFTPDELKLPDTLKGKKVKEYAISKYPNTMIDGRPYSLPFMPPAVNVNHDEAIRLCESKGPGWHLITNDEWAALAHQSRKLNTLPRGNTDSGKNHKHPEETGTTYEGGYGKTLTGSGPITWNHDGTAEGVSDMCGNVWEHVGGLRFVDGQVQVIPENGAAAGADQSPTSPEWTPIYTPDGDTIYYNVDGGEITLQSVAPDEAAWNGVPFMDLEARGDIEVPDKLIELGLYPTSEDYNGTDYFWLDTDGERCVYRGGSWGNGARAGVFSLRGNDSRADSHTYIGFRSALVRYSGDSGDLEYLDDENQKSTDGEKTEAEKSSPSPLPDTLPGVVKLMLANVLTEIYTTAGGKDLHTFEEMARNASNDEIKETVQIASQLAQLNISAYAMRHSIEQIKLAATTSVTLTFGKEDADHE